jgi:hypothetical protein
MYHKEDLQGKEYYGKDAYWKEYYGNEYYEKYLPPYMEVYTLVNKHRIVYSYE